MEQQVFDFNEFKKQSAKIEKKIAFKRKLNDCLTVIKENKEIIMFFAPPMISAIAFGGKAAIRNFRLKKEENLKNLYCYDRSLGHYWKLRRELTNDEWVAIDRRKKNGERLADILDELKVLK